MLLNWAIHLIKIIMGQLMIEKGKKKKRKEKKRKPGHLMVMAVHE